MNNPIFQQFNNMQGRNANPALYKQQLTDELKKMQSDGVDYRREIEKGLSEGKINRQQVNFAFGIAKNIAQNVLGIK